MPHSHRGITGGAQDAGRFLKMRSCQRRKPPAQASKSKPATSTAPTPTPTPINPPTPAPATTNLALANCRSPGRRHTLASDTPPRPFLFEQSRHARRRHTLSDVYHLPRRSSRTLCEVATAMVVASLVSTAPVLKRVLVQVNISIRVGVVMLRMCPCIKAWKFFSMGSERMHNHPAPARGQRHVSACRLVASTDAAILRNALHGRAQSIKDVAHEHAVACRALLRR